MEKSGKLIGSTGEKVASLFVEVGKLQVAILARSSREMFQTVRID